jgi:Tol biopolymer transport system component
MENERHQNLPGATTARSPSFRAVFEPGHRARRLVILAVITSALFLAVAGQAVAGTVSVELIGTATGAVRGGDAAEPEKIDCDNTGGGVAGPVCSSEFSLFDQVTLTASPGPEARFKGWTKNGRPECREPDGTPSNPCTFFTGLESPSMTANFSLVALTPEVAIDDVADADIGATKATFHGRVNPKGSEIGACRFQYVAQTDPDGFASSQVQSVPCDLTPAEIGEGEAFVDVQATATLQPNKTYRIRLVAENENSEPATATAEAAPFTTLALPPTATTGGAFSVSDATATLTATVNPNNSPTSFSFEYVDEAEYQANGFADATSTPTFSAGSGGAAVLMTPNVDGFQPSTTYHFRVVATNDCAKGCGTATGGAATFTTRPQIVLPQRHYELVSAIDTNGFEALPDVAATDGDRYAYVTFLPTPPNPVTGKKSIYVSSRQPDGSWSQTAVGAPAPPPGSEDNGTVADFFSADLAKIAFGTGTNLLDPNDQNNSEDTYLQSLGSSSLTWLSRDPSLAGPQLEHGAAEPEYISPDGSRVIFSSRRRLLPGDDGSAPSRRSLYEWDEGALSLVSRVPSSGSFCDDVTGPACVGAPPGEEESRLGSGAGGSHETTYGSVSRDGSRVVFQSGSEGGFTDGHRLYVRLDGQRTVEASASAPGAPPVAYPWSVNYGGADENGEDVFFTSPSPLTEDSTAPDTQFGPADLYLYDVGARSLRDLTPSAGGAGVERVYAISADGRRVYFTDTKRLGEAGDLTESAAPGEVLEGAPGGPNLYLAELEGSAAKLTFIATIDPNEDSPGDPSGGVNERLAWREVAASPDGSLLAFRDYLPVVPGRSTGYATGSGDLTEGSNAEGSSTITNVTAATGSFAVGEKIVGPGLHAHLANEAATIAAVDPSAHTITVHGVVDATVSGAALSAGFSQVFVYDAARDELSCASCPPDGAAPTSQANLTQNQNTETNPAAPHARNVSNDGSVFFDTATGLLSADVNGARDVYEWRGGKLALISAGVGTQTSRLASASTDGSTVFFQSADSLVPAAQAGIPHIYAARVGPVPESSTPAQPCTEADCRGASPGAPTFDPPASATFNGLGNLTPPPATTPKPTTAAQIRAQKLAKALKACRTKHDRHKRTACERRARKRYGPTKSKAHKSSTYHHHSQGGR